MPWFNLNYTSVKICLGLEFRNQEESSSDLMANDKKQLSSDLIANDKNESKSKTCSTSLESTFPENRRVLTARRRATEKLQKFWHFALLSPDI